jgi:hypothetical protein
MYRKPTQTDAVILHYFNHSYSQKESFLNSTNYRLECVPLNKYNYQHELNVIYNIANKNNCNYIKSINF